jgi:hypothetical protein
MAGRRRHTDTEAEPSLTKTHGGIKAKGEAHGRQDQGYNEDDQNAGLKVGQTVEMCIFTVGDRQYSDLGHLALCVSLFGMFCVGM